MANRALQFTDEEMSFGTTGVTSSKLPTRTFQSWVSFLFLSRAPQAPERRKLSRPKEESVQKHLQKYLKLGGLSEAEYASPGSVGAGGQLGG